LGPRCRETLRGKEGGTMWSVAARGVRAGASRVASGVRAGASGAAPRRGMSGGAHTVAEEEAEMDKWIKISYAMVAGCVAVGAYNYMHHGHQHRHELADEMAHMKMRTKRFPWECKDCSYFDLECWDECKNPGAAKKGHH